MKYRDFEDFLQERHQKENPYVLDDDIPDNYNEWLDSFEQQDWIRLANTYGQHKANQVT